MFNQIVAALLGATAIIVGIVATIRFELLSAKIYDTTTTKEAREKDVNAFLDRLDDSRSERYGQDRHGMLRQLDGYRDAWNAYANLYADNFETDMGYCAY